MKISVFFTEELLPVKQFILDTNSCDLNEVEESSDVTPPTTVASIIFFHTREIAVFPVEMPPGLTKAQRKLVARNSLEDEPIFDPDQLVISDVPEGVVGEVGVGVAKTEFVNSLRSNLTDNFVLSIQPFEGLLASVLGQGIWLVNFGGYFKFLKVTENGLAESFVFDSNDYQEIKDLLSSKQISFDEVIMDEKIFNRCLDFIRTNPLGHPKGSIEFSTPEPRSKLINAFWGSAQPARKVVYLAFLLAALIWTLIFVHRAVGYGITKFYAQTLMGVGSSQEAESKTAQLRQELSKLEQDINQLSALTYPNVFTILAALSQTLPTPLDSIEFAPPKLVISGVANEYAPIENLKRELIKDRELFCSVKLENLRDFRNQKKFTFEISLCRT